MKNEPKRLLDSPAVRTGLKVAVLATLLLAMLVPLAMIRSLVEEREARQSATTAEIIALHGGRQELAGPALVIPVVTREVDSEGVEREATRRIAFLAEEVELTARLETEVLRRGIYEAPVYLASVTVDGTLALPARDSFPREDIASVRWEDAELVVGVSGISGLRSEPGVWFDGRALPVTGTPLAPGGLYTGFAAPLELAGPPMSRENGAWPFRVELDVSGGGGFHVVPTAYRSAVRIDSAWASPGFTGGILPAAREVSDNGFTATWTTTALGTGMPEAWNIADDTGTDRGPYGEPGGRFTTGASPAAGWTRVGVDLVQPVDAYQLTLRSVKYGVLFVLLPIVALFLLEALTAVTIHPLQYLLVAAAKVVFYLLLLSLSEHIAFALAYWAGALATTALITVYVVAFTKRSAHAMAVAALVVAEYLVLFVALQSEDYALLIGSLGLFAMLGAVMLATRRIDWYGSIAR